MTVEWEIREGEQGNVDGQELWFNGCLLTPHHPKTLQMMEAALQKLLQQCERVGEGQIQVMAIEMEMHMATGLFNHGDLTIEHLDNSFPGDSGLNLIMELNGQQYLVVVVPNMTRHDSYQFVVDGHPRGETRVMTLDDLILE